MKQKLIEILGWYGTFAIVGAYALSSFGLLNSSSISYQLLNLTGAMGIVVLSFYKKVYQSGVLNLIWTIIALTAIFKIIFS